MDIGFTPKTQKKLQFDGLIMTTDVFPYSLQFGGVSAASPESRSASALIFPSDGNEPKTQSLTCKKKTSRKETKGKEREEKKGEQGKEKKR